MNNNLEKTMLKDIQIKIVQMKKRKSILETSKEFKKILNDSIEEEVELSKRDSFLDRVIDFELEQLQRDIDFSMQIVEELKEYLDTNVC